MKKSSIAVIPARGGSKRIPNKNIKEFAGKPAIAYAINAAVESNLFSDIIVTTDSLSIAEIATSIWPVIIVNRPESLADDFTPTVPVVAHAVREYLFHKQLEEIDVCCIYPINPFLIEQDLIEGHELLMSSQGISYVNPICSFPYPPQRAVRIRNQKIEMVDPELALTRSQDLEEYFHDAGQWYWGNSKSWLNGNTLLMNSVSIQIPRWRCQDIDTLEDWKYAEILFKTLNETTN